MPQKREKDPSGEGEQRVGDEDPIDYCGPKEGEVKDLETLTVPVRRWPEL